MEKSTIDSMIKKYTDELIKMNKDKSLPDLTEEMYPEFVQETKEVPFQPEKSVIAETETESEKPEIESEFLPAENNIQETEQEFSDEETPEKSDELTGKARFSARVFTGNNAYPVENAKVLVVRDGKLFTYLVTDRNGKTKSIFLPAFPEANSLDINNSEQYINYTGEVYAKDFAPKKDLLITAVGGSDIVLDVQLTPVSERVK